MNCSIKTDPGYLKHKASGSVQIINIYLSGSGTLPVTIMFRLGLRSSITRHPQRAYSIDAVVLGQLQVIFRLKNIGFIRKVRWNHEMSSSKKDA